jgi:hypothetical protein
MNTDPAITILVPVFLGKQTATPRVADPAEGRDLILVRISVDRLPDFTGEG